MKNIKISDENWRFLMETKLDFGYKTIDAVFTKLIQSFNKTYVHKQKEVQSK
jgi:hypothetical protein